MPVQVPGTQYRLLGVAVQTGISRQGFLSESVRTVVPPALSLVTLLLAAAVESARTAVAVLVECRATTNHSTAARTIRPSSSGQTFRPSFRRIGISATELSLALSR